ncbi:MAG TPA: aldehyde dehydrogenase family protein, partial [Roseococcus sp.]|nr:aldehyde dehydrogenase family protein [Roseococcus sp.]
MLDTLAKLPLKDPDLFRQANRIGDAWVQADSGKTLSVRNPATGEAIGVVPAMGRAETARAIAAAGAAFPAWRKLLAKERAAILRRMAELMLANADDLA